MRSSPLGLAFALALVAATSAPTAMKIPAAGQLDRLDETHALVRIRVAPGVLNLATAVLP